MRPRIGCCRGECAAVASIRGRRDVERGDSLASRVRTGRTIAGGPPDRAGTRPTRQSVRPDAGHRRVLLGRGAVASDRTHAVERERGGHRAAALVFAPHAERRDVVPGTANRCRYCPERLRRARLPHVVGTVRFLDPAGRVASSESAHPDRRGRRSALSAILVPVPAAGSVLEPRRQADGPAAATNPRRLLC